MDIETHLNSETVNEVGPDDPLVVAPDESIADAIALLQRHRYGGVLVCRDEKLVGIFTERDALRLMADGGDFSAAIETVMVTTPATIQHGETVGGAIRKMAKGGYRRLPIIDEAGRPSGMVSVAAIVHYLVQFFPRAVYNLPPVTHPLTTQDREGP